MGFFCPVAVIKKCFHSAALSSKFNSTTAVASRFGLPHHPMVVTKSSLKWGLWGLLFIQLLYISIPVTDCSGRYGEGGCHLQVSKCIPHSGGSPSGINTWSSVKLCQRSHDKQQTRVLHFCPGQWGDTFSCISSGSSASSVGGCSPNLLVFTWWWQHLGKDGGMRFFIGP